MDIQVEETKEKKQLILLEINPIKIYSSVQQIFIHPLHFTHIVHREDNIVYLYDQISMEEMGRTKVQILAGMKLFAFSNNFNIFYGLKEAQFIMAFQLQRDGSLLHKKLPLSPNANVGLSYLNAHTFSCIDQCSKLVCVNSLKMYFLDTQTGQINYIPQLKYEQKLIQTQFATKIGSFDWIIGCQNYLYSVSFSQNLNNYQINNRIQVGRIKKLGSDNNRNHCRYAYAINQKNQVSIVTINPRTKMLIILEKISFLDSDCLYVNFFRFSVNTSTTNKFRNSLYIMFYCKKLSNFHIPVEKSQMVQQCLQVFLERQEIVHGNQQFQQVIPNQHFNYIMQFQVPQQNQKMKFAFNNTRYLMRNMPQIKISPWFNDLAQNFYFYLCKTGQTIMIDLSEIKQLGVRAEQWVCLGYRFQALSKNQIYQQKNDQFEQLQNQNELEQQINQNFLDSYDESGLPEYLIVKNKVSRLKCLQI